MKLRRTIAVFVTALAILVPMLHAEPAEASPGEFTGKINALRASKGLGSLSTNRSLSAQAQRWAESMAAANKISHNPSLSSTPGNWTKVGENVGTGGSVGAIFDALVASPGHYRNMVEGKYNSVGVGVAVGSDGRIYTCHVFASFPGAGGGGSAKAPAAAKSAAPAKAAKSNSGAKAPAANNNSGGPANTEAPEPAPEAPAPPPPPAPSKQIVTGLGEVGSIHLQG